MALGERDQTMIFMIDLTRGLDLEVGFELILLLC
jgi:hypothetical protein